MSDSKFESHSFVAAANEFCTLVEQIKDCERAEWLTRIGNLLLQLESEIEQMETAHPMSPYARFSDFENRFEIYSQLKEFLAEEDEYWSEGDLRASDGNKTGSLSDDFADIYFEIKRGLMFHAQPGADPSHAIRIWIGSYRDHWRQHLVDARKQLFEFKKVNRI